MYRATISNCGRRALRVSEEARLWQSFEQRLPVFQASVSGVRGRLRTPKAAKSREFHALN